MRSKKKHYSFKRKRMKPTSSRGISEGVLAPPILKEAVNQTTGPHGESEWDSEEDEEWLAFYEQRVQELEELQEEIHSLLFLQGIEEERLWKGKQLMATIRRMCMQELESSRRALAAQKLLIAPRDEVCTLCSQGSSPITRFIPILLPACREELSGDDEQKLDRVTVNYSTDIWLMMADTYPKDCPVHYYLECPADRYSAEVYRRQEQAEREAQRRKDTGEGTFEVIYFEESDLIVLFTKHTETLGKIARALGVPPGELIEEVADDRHE